MRSQGTRIFRNGIILLSLLHIGSAFAETEYNMFRPSPIPLHALVSLQFPNNDDCSTQNMPSRISSAALAQDEEGARIGAMISAKDVQGQDRVLTTQFQPSPLRHWYGNLKAYGVKTNPASSESPVELMSDVSDTKISVACRDQTRRCISPTARSVWTASSRPDGNVVTRGGAADQIPKVQERKTFLQSGKKLLPLRSKFSVKNLTQEEQSIVERIARQQGWQGSNLQADAAQTEVESALRLYNRLAGIDANNDEYQQLHRKNQQPWLHRDQETSWLGATIFGTPVHVNYETSESGSYDVVWWSSSDGFLRAVDARSGKMLVSILPEAVIESIVTLNMTDSGDVVSGLDTSWVVLRHDHNQDGKINRIDGDYIYLYGGMRRGGMHVYAWDITEPTSPSVLFEHSAETVEFSALAYTWSTPLLANVWLPGFSQPETVLVFGGGYDNRLDARPVSDQLPCQKRQLNCGAAIYFVKATGIQAGKLLWTVSSGHNLSKQTRIAELANPIAAPIKALDIDGNGVTDFFYALDMQGQVFRLQMPQNAEAGLSGSMIASLHDEADKNTDNAYLFAPSIAVMKAAGSVYSISLALGSGNITQPYGSTKSGRLFVLNDTVTTDVLTSVSAVTLHSEGTLWLESTKSYSDTVARLWVLPALEVGEKLAAPPIIAEGKAFYSTFLPPAQDRALCESLPAKQRLWAVDIQTGKPIFDKAGEISAHEPQHYVVDRGEMAAGRPLTPMLLDNNFTLFSGTEAVMSSSLVAAPKKLRWRQVRTGPTVRHL